MPLLRSLLGASVAAAAAFVVHLAYEAGEFSSHAPHGLYRCSAQLREAVIGAEDIAVDHEAGAAYVSAQDRFGPISRGEPRESDAPGSVWRYSFADATLERVRLRGPDGGPLRAEPHGIDSRGEFLAFVNHAVGRESVEVYRKDAGGAAAAVRVASVSHPLMTGINDVALRPGGDSFYVSNWLHYRPKSFMGAVEKYGRRPWTDVLFCSVRGGGAAEPQCRRVAENLSMANGVTLSPDARTLWVVETVGKSLNEYDALPDGSLRLRRRVPTLGYLGDNLAHNPADGSLLLVAHTRALTLVSYFHRPRHVGGSHSPWAVLRLDAGADEFREVAYSLGELVSAGTVAATYQNTTLVGTVMDRGVLVCSGPNGGLGDDE